MKIIKIILLLLFISLLGSFAYYSYAINTPLDKNGSDLNITIAKGEGVKQIAADLEKAGLIRSAYFFEVYVWLEKKQANFQAGDYTLNAKLSARDIAAAIIKGDTRNNEKNIKIIEGWTTKDIGEYLEKEGIDTAVDFYQLAGYPLAGYRLLSSKAPDYSGAYPFLKDKPKYAGLEGYLFPDTYRIYKDATSSDAVKKMLDNFDAKFTKEMRDEIAREKKTVFQIVTLASIIEKEVKTPTDMSIVSGIFWNRMKNGQALEVDSTLSYIFNDTKASHTTDETKVDSPYNTYKYRGLPPGPISNPGLNAIKAAIYPQETPFNYFLTRPDTGETVFAKTYQEHLGNKAKYLK